MKQIFKTLSALAVFTIVILCTSVTAANAQLPDDDDPEPTPIDGGLTLLLAAGAGYGAKKWRDARKKKAADEPVEK